MHDGGAAKADLRLLELLALGFKDEAIARHLGGGGHARAAGCEISGNLDNARYAVLGEVRKELEHWGLLERS